MMGHCTCDPARSGACPTCLWFDALFTAARLGVLGADRAQTFRSHEPEVNLRALVRRVALVERAVGLGRLSDFIR